MGAARRVGGDEPASGSTTRCCRSTPPSATSTATPSRRPRRSCCGRRSSATSSTARRSSSTSTSSPPRTSGGSATGSCCCCPTATTARAPSTRRPASSASCWPRRGQHPAVQRHHGGAVLPPAAPPGVQRAAHPAHRVHAEGGAALKQTRSHDRRADDRVVPRGARRPRCRRPRSGRAGRVLQRQGGMGRDGRARQARGAGRRDPRRAAVSVADGAAARPPAPSLRQRQGAGVAPGGTREHGPWRFIENRTWRVKELGYDMRHVARVESGSPATGSKAIHDQELVDLMDETFVRRPLERPAVRRRRPQPMRAPHGPVTPDRESDQSPHIPDEANPGRRRRRLEHRHRGPLDAEPRPTQRGGAQLPRGVSRRQRHRRRRRHVRPPHRQERGRRVRCRRRPQRARRPASRRRRPRRRLRARASPTSRAPRILSNDSFQEFHGTYPWLFDEGRLVGGKPVPHVGWVFVNRLPVKGPVSRKARAASRPTSRRPATRSASKLASQPMPVPTAPPPGPARHATTPTDEGGGRRRRDRRRRRGDGHGGLAARWTGQRAVAVPRLRPASSGRQQRERRRRVVLLARRLRHDRRGSRLRAVAADGQPAAAERPRGDEAGRGGHPGRRQLRPGAPQHRSRPCRESVATSPSSAGRKHLRPAARRRPSARRTARAVGRAARRAEEGRRQEGAGATPAASHQEVAAAAKKAAPAARRPSRARQPAEEGGSDQEGRRQDSQAGEGRRPKTPPAGSGRRRSAPTSGRDEEGRRRPADDQIRDVERQLAQRPPRPRRAVDRRHQARHPVHAGDQAHRRGLPGDGVRGPRLRVGAPRRGPLERRRHPVPGRADRRDDGLRRRPRAGLRGAGHDGPMRGRLRHQRLRAQRAVARPRAVPVQAQLARTAGRPRSTVSASSTTR